MNNSFSVKVYFQINDERQICNFIYKREKTSTCNEKVIFIEFRGKVGILRGKGYNKEQVNGYGNKDLVRWYCPDLLL